jgi:hypothetical protein
MTWYEVGNIQADLQNFYSLRKGHETTGEWAGVNNSLYKKGVPNRIRKAYFTGKSCNVYDVLMPKRQAHNLTTRVNSAHTLAAGHVSR